MLLSIHIPKTAGTSFGVSLNQHYAKGYRGDYSDYPYNGESASDRQRAAMRKAFDQYPEDFEGAACVHGHFLAIKYRLLAEQTPCRFVTWLRHPVDRLLSHYYYWQESYDPQTCSGRQRVCLEEGWSFEKFALCEEWQDMQSQFLWSVPLCSFAFVGITEHYEEDFARFCQAFLGTKLAPVHTNITRSKPPLESLDPGLRTEVEQFQAQDMALYEAALARRKGEMGMARPTYSCCVAACGPRIATQTQAYRA